MEFPLQAFYLMKITKQIFINIHLSPFYNYTKGKIAELHYLILIILKKIFTVPILHLFKMNFMAALFLKSHGLSLEFPQAIPQVPIMKLLKLIPLSRIVNQRVHIKYTDSITTRLSSFSVAGTLEHSFHFYNIFSKKDGLSFTPQFSFITGINTYHVSHKSTIANYNSFTKKRLKRIRHFQSQGLMINTKPNQSGLILTSIILSEYFILNPNFILIIICQKQMIKGLRKFSILILV